MKLTNEEGAEDLAEKLAKCGQEFFLDCTSCGYTHRCEKACNNKWCPVCARRKSAQRVAKYERAILEMRWPLALAFTITNTETICRAQVRRFQRNLRRLIRTKLFRECVKGGIYSIEIVNTGRGWHLHAHLIVDSEWLSLKTAAPRRNDSRERKAGKFKAAQQELHDTWCGIIDQLLANIYTSRVHGREVIVETLKYSVKPADLLASPDPIAPAIRAIAKGHLSTPFGSLWGVRRSLKEEARPPFCCPSCSETGTMIPSEIADRMLAAARDPMRKFRGPRRAS